jgi:hypothetical protein
MKPQISEFSYGYALTDELIHLVRLWGQTCLLTYGFIQSTKLNLR